uniref:Uncharacterized protein n=1 Tax=Medicago truncatula TaxID=3880 RepID=A2Q5G8_MEDTR|nr:hypothetical protein MtrDRAFT_AC161399g53v2 [Medicago truncatula]
MIFVQLKLDNFDDNQFSPLVIGQKQWREKEEEERIKNTCEYERNCCLKSCQKVVLQISLFFFF